MKPNHHTGPETFGIVIDTEQYSGNFERELCAFLTGRIGECEVGQEYAHENPLFDNVIDKPDEHGCRRPCEIHPTRGWFNHGHGGHFRDGQEVKALEHYRAAVKEWATTRLIKPAEAILKRLQAGESVQGWSVDACNQQIERAEQEIRKAEELTTVRKCLAYQSVLIHTDAPPTAAQIDCIKSRAPMFADEHKKKASYLRDFELTITGVRKLNH